MRLRGDELSQGAWMEGKLVCRLNTYMEGKGASSTRMYAG